MTRNGPWGGHTLVGLGLRGGIGGTNFVQGIAVCYLKSVPFATFEHIRII
jgi:hypothetical protein